MEKGPQLGSLITDGELRRDAIHIAVAPVTAGERLLPAQPVGILDPLRAHGGPPSVGIVDPFLSVAVEPGQRFWLVLFPNTVTSLRHVWTHPEFTAAAYRAEGLR